MKHIEKLNQKAIALCVQVHAIRSNSGAKPDNIEKMNTDVKCGD